MNEGDFSVLEENNVGASQQKKERKIPASIIVQDIVSSFHFGKKFTFNEVIMLINGTTRYGAKNLVASVNAIRGGLRKMSCVTRSPDGVKPVTMMREMPCEELCSNCSRRKNGSEGCIINDAAVRKTYYPEKVED